MGKSLKIVILLLIVVLLVQITYSYAIEQNGAEKQFFEVSKLEVTKNETIEMTLNLNRISYDMFLFELQSDETIENLEIAANDEITAEKSHHEIAMEISKKDTNLNTINLYYTIPEDKKVGDTIRFVATITDMTEEEDTSETNTNSTKTDTSVVNQTNTTKTDTSVVNQTNTTKTDTSLANQANNINTDTNQTNSANSGKNTESSGEEKTQRIEIEVKIIEEKIESGNSNQEQGEDTKTEQKPNNQENSGNNQQEIGTQGNHKQETQTFNQNETVYSTSMQKEAMFTSNSSLQLSGETSSQKETQVTYNGSDNNYLSELFVEENTLNKEFSKENTTYFLTVENEIETLNITATAEEENATVCIYGNENLKQGTNKILISVTAENGNVRNYRIYVNKNA